MASKPPQCSPNYHLASDCLVITGARGWTEEKREEGRGRRVPQSHTSPLCPGHLGHSPAYREKQEDAGRGGMAETDTEGLGRTDVPQESWKTRCWPVHCGGLIRILA